MTERDLLHGLVAIPSVTGTEETAVAYLQQRARDDGFHVMEDAAGNFIATTGSGSRTLLLLGHIDTAPGHIPVQLRGGALWGRGSVDAKGSLAAFYAAARRHLDTPDLRIVVVGAVDEEGDSRGARGLPPDLDPAWIVIGEPSGVDGMTLGYKGILRGSVTFRRDSIHGGHPQANANDAFVAAWADLPQTVRSGAGFDDVSARIDRLSSHSDGLSDHLEATVQFRVPPTVAVADLVASVSVHLAAHEGSFHPTEALDAVQSDRRNPLAAALSGAIRAGGMTPRPKQKTGTSDWNVVAPQWPEALVLAYGPGDSHLDHAPGEHLVLTEYDAAVDVLDRVLTSLGS